MSYFKILSLLGFLFTATFPAIGQEKADDSRNKIQFGLKAGLNYSNVYNRKGEAFKPMAKPGFVGGGFVSIPLTTHMGAQIELLYSQKGFSATGIILGEPYDFKRTSSYIDLPLLFAFKPSTLLTLLGGPQYSYLVRQKDVFATAGSSIEQEQEFLKDDERVHTFCFVLGADVNLKNFIVSGRAGWDLLDNSKNEVTATPKYKNAWIQMTLGYRFYQ
ncbi:MAG: PorT family protein [Chitinophagaceae bacterium]|nr:MAG: PorT family protein [Chitinophagaceae bacterium]